MPTDASRPASHGAVAGQDDATQLEGFRMDASAKWKSFFLHWPPDLPRRGVVVTSYNEQVPFESFLTSESMLLVERRAPDAVGARKVVLLYESVQAVKVVDPVDAAVFNVAGFRGAQPGA